MAVDVSSHVGEKYGRLTVVGPGIPGHRNPRGRKVPRQYECRCECGKEVLVPIHRLRSGNTKSCGCITKTLNGLSYKPEYKVWVEMHRRCSSPSHKRYSEWGGRGIKVCPEWASFETFLKDMGSRPSSKHSIERADNELGYSKSNCYWATPDDQNNNKSNNRYLTLNGVTKSMALWCKELGVPYSRVRSRVYLQGMSDEDALLLPKNTKRTRK